MRGSETSKGTWSIRGTISSMIAFSLLKDENLQRREPGQERGGDGGGGAQGCNRREGAQRRPRRRLDRPLEEVAKAVGGGYCRLQMPLKLALAVWETVAGHRLGAMEGACLPPPSNASLGGGGGTSVPRTVQLRDGAVAVVIEGGLGVHQRLCYSPLTPSVTGGGGQQNPLPQPLFPTTTGGQHVIVPF